MTKSEKIAFLESFFATAGYPASSEIFSDLLGERVDPSEISLLTPVSEENEKWQKKYLKKANFWLPLLRFIPGLRGAAVCNSLAFGGGGQQSDIDLFLITAKNRLWTVRLLTTLFFQICGVRRHGSRVSGRLCLSFFIDETALDFQKIAITPRDPYLALWISSLLPFFGHEIFQEFAEKNRLFVSQNAPVCLRFEKNLEILPSNKTTIFSSKRGDIFENFLKRIFLPRTQAKAKKLADSSGTIISDHILTFHNSDRRKFFAEKTCSPPKNAAQ